MDGRFLFVASLLALGATLTVSLDVAAGGQCKIKWLFGISCSEVNVKLVSQIKAWQVSDDCQFTQENCSYKVSDDCQFPQENCSYKLVSAAPYVVTANHTSPKTKKVNALQFLLEQSMVCKMTGDATAAASKDGGDDGSNFCSLQNLMNGSSLINAVGYKQFSNKWICPGFDSANCTLT